METTVRATCPQCQTTLRIPSKWVGQAVKCKKCGATVRVKGKPENPTPADTLPNTPPLPPPPAAAPGTDDVFGSPAPVVPAAPQAASALPALPAYPLPPGYPHPVPGYALPAVPVAPQAGPLPAVPVAVPATPQAASAIQPTKPGAKPAGHPVARPVSLTPQAVSALPIAGAGPSNAFDELEPIPSKRTDRKSRYRRSSGASKFIWIGLILLLLGGGLIAGGIFGVPIVLAELEKQRNPPEQPPEQPPEPKVVPPSTSVKAVYPRRMLCISVTRYMYLNQLTASNGNFDLTKPAAQRVASDWRVPQGTDNNQLFILSDTVTGTDARLPMKNVVQGTYTEFCNTSRAQDRIVIYFGGHAIEKDGKAYLAPVEAEIEGEGFEQTLIPLEHFYGELEKCKAAQKVVIWDVCRFNPNKGRARPGSEPMSEGLFKALSSPPAGVQAVLSCQVGENALEYGIGDGSGGQFSYRGSFLLEALRSLSEPKANRLPKMTPKPEDPLPIAEWTPALTKRTQELAAELIEHEPQTPGKQTVTLHGTAPASLNAPNPEEKAAVRFEFPAAPKGASASDIKSLEREFAVPPLRSTLGSVQLADFPFPAKALEDYKGDGVTLEEIASNKEKYPLRVAVVDSLNQIRKLWMQGVGGANLRENLPAGPFDDNFKKQIQKEQADLAFGIASLEATLDKLKVVAEMRESEPKRWQANYDFALAAVKSRYAYLNEYNKMYGLIITDTLPALDPKLGQDGYILVPSETLRSGKDIKKVAEEASEAFQEITTKYPSTPWAIQAKQEKNVQIGMTWKPAAKGMAQK